jgi:hypothetical protein
MDRDERIKMLLDMQEHPEQFSETALERLLNDTESQELMKATAQLKRAMNNDEFTMSEEDVENDWHDFASAHFAEQKTERSWLKIAATIIGVLFMTGVVFAAIRVIRNNTSIQKTEQKELPVVQQTVSTDTVNTTTIVESEPVIFDNISLDIITKEIAAYYKTEMDLQNEQAKQLRFYFVWKQDDSLQEVVEKLNMFEQVDITIENDKLIVR